MNDLSIKILQTVFSALTFGGIGLFFWSFKKNNGKEEKRSSEVEKDVKDIDKRLVKIETEYKLLKESFDSKNVDKAYDSAKRCHERVDGLEKE